MIRPSKQQSDEEASAGEDDDEQEWSGLPEPPEIDHEAEYIDEDRYTTVTVEAMDLSKDGLHEKEEAQANLDSSEEKQPDGTKRTNGQKQGKRIWTKDKPEKDSRAPKRKRKKFRYENKAERKLTRLKEKSKNSRQAKARRSD